MKFSSSFILNTSLSCNHQWEYQGQENRRKQHNTQVKPLDLSTIFQCRNCFDFQFNSIQEKKENLNFHHHNHNHHRQNTHPERKKNNLIIWFLYVFFLSSQFESQISYLDFFLNFSHTQNSNSNTVIKAFCFFLPFIWMILEKILFQFFKVFSRVEIEMIWMTLTFISQV